MASTQGTASLRSILLKEMMSPTESSSNALPAGSPTVTWKRFTSGTANLTAWAEESEQAPTRSWVSGSRVQVRRLSSEAVQLIRTVVRKMMWKFAATGSRTTLTGEL